MEYLKNNKHLVFALFFALLNMGAIFFIFGFQTYSDSYQYFKAIDWFQGKGTDVQLNRLLRPLGPLLAAPFGEVGLIVENIIFYFLSVFLVFKIVDLIFNNKFQAFLASVFFFTATPVIESGLSYLTDMGAWFFFLLSIFLTLLYFKDEISAQEHSFTRSAKPTAYPKLVQKCSLASYFWKKESLIIINGLLSSIGVLMKENGGLGILFFVMMVLLSGKFNFKEKLSKILLFSIPFLIPIAIVQFLMYNNFHYTSLDWYLRNTPASDDSLLLVSMRYLGQLFRILGILWIFVLIGAWREWKNRNWNWDRIKIYLALLPPSLSFLLWTEGAGGRAVFVFAPLGILLASRGIILLKEKQDRIVLFLLALIILNYAFCALNPYISFTDIIYTSLFSR